MKLQSRYHNHTVVIKAPTFSITPYGRELIPGLFARFEGAQRIFDSDYAAETLEWTPEQKAKVEEKLLANSAFQVDYFLAPGERLPEELAAKLPASKQPPEARLRCTAIWTEMGTVVQCPEDATAGRQFCHTHDPETVKIKTGGGTTAG